MGKYFKSPSTSTPEEEDDKKEDEVRDDAATEMLQRQADGTMKSVAARTVKIIGEDGSVKTVKAFDTDTTRTPKKKSWYIEYMSFLVMGGVCFICIVVAIVTCICMRAPAEVDSSLNPVVPDIENGLAEQENQLSEQENEL